MEFKLPEIHDIGYERNGIRFDGSWYIILSDMVVNYKGFTSSIADPGKDKGEIAVGMLRQLVEKQYVQLESLRAVVPHQLLAAAHEYVNSAEEDVATEEFVAALGDPGRLSHQQISWLCVNALSMIVPTWKHMCDGDAAGEVYGQLRNWLEDSSHEIDWVVATVPAVARRNGERVEDCDACRLEPTADAIASAAAYLHTSKPSDAIACLLAANSAYQEGCHTADAPERFEKWLVFEALPVSLQCEPV